MTTVPSLLEFEPYHFFTIGLGVLGFVLQGTALAVAGTWKLGTMELRMAQSLESHRTEVDRAIEEAAKAARDGNDAMRREIGESLIAMQKKINQFELWTRDTFVRRESFGVVTKRIEDAITGQGDKTDKRLDKIDAKLDRLQESRA